MEGASAPGQPERIIGRYALYGALASGGMATVHLGRLLGPVGFSRTVAIKRLHEQFATDPEFVSSFLDEARLAARIQHPNVVPTLDVVATDGQLFLVMEYVQGESVSRLLKVTAAEGRTIPPRVVVGVLAGALHGLHSAHEAKNEKGEPLHIVHRDVSPQNILVGIDGVPRVLDFGVAKAVGRLQSTRTGQLKGKVAYMSPEQLRSEPVDRRTDVFAASVVLWETLVARRLFSGDSEGAVLNKVLFGFIDPPSRRAPDISPELDAIVLRGLERDVDKRWQTARDMAVALEDCVAPATATQISAWVESLARDSLAERAGRVAEIESATTQSGDRVSQVLSEILRGDGAPSGPALPSSPRPDDAGISQRSSISVATQASPVPAGRRWAPFAVLFALVASAAVATTPFLLLRPPRASGAAPTVATSAPVPEASSAAAVPVLSASVASAVPSATVAPPVVTATSHAAARPTAPTAPLPRASAKPDCSNPFVRDELGRKIYKKECLE